MEHSYIDKLAWIYVKEGKILSSRSRGKDTYYIPGGKREAGETDAQALIREIKEELSVDLIESTLKPFGVFETQAHGKPIGTMIRMTCYEGDFSGTIAAAAEIEEVVWLDYAGREKSSPVDKLIFDYLEKQGRLN